MEFRVPIMVSIQRGYVDLASQLTKHDQVQEWQSRWTRVGPVARISVAIHRAARPASMGGLQNRVQKPQPLPISRQRPNRD